MSSLVLVLTDDRLIAYLRRRSRVESIGEVLLDAGLEAFIYELYNNYRIFCCSLIIDRSDEEYILENLPTLRPIMRNRAIKIRLQRHFTATALTAGVPVSKTQILCIGVEKKSTLHCFLTAIEKLGLVFDTIYSLAVLLSFQCASAQFSSNTVLVISSHRGRVWRYSLVQSGKLLLSRSIFIADTINKCSEVVAELENTQKYTSRILGGEEVITTVYAGQEIITCNSLPGKLLTSIQRRYRLLQCNDLYEEIISSSRFEFCKPSAYKSKATNTAYRRYLVVNFSVFASLTLLIFAVFHLYSSTQYSNEVIAKTFALQRVLETPSDNKAELGSASALSNLKLEELQRVVEVFSGIDLATEASDLQLGLARALSKHPDINLEKVSYKREYIENTQVPSKVVPMALSANFRYSGLTVFAKELSKFREAIENAELQIVQNSSSITQVRNKGLLGGFVESERSNNIEFSLTVTLKDHK